MSCDTERILYYITTMDNGACLEATPLETALSYIIVPNKYARASALSHSLAHLCHGANVLERKLCGSSRVGLLLRLCWGPTSEVQHLERNS